MEESKDIKTRLEAALAVTTEKAAQALSAIDAQQFSQAACNLANALSTCDDMERRKDKKDDKQ